MRHALVRARIESRDSNKRCEMSAKPPTELTGRDLGKEEDWPEFSPYLGRVVGCYLAGTPGEGLACGA